jgi:hypothetical protein
MKKFKLRSHIALGVSMAALTFGCSGNIPGQVDSEPASSKVGGPAVPAEGARDIIVHINPTTGEFITPPTHVLPGQIAQPPVVAAKELLPELQPTLSPVPGGGVMILLDDRFHTPLTATIDGEGKVQFEHKPARYAAEEKK